MFTDIQIKILNESCCFPLEEGIKILSQKVVKTRKEHMCWNCNGVVNKSEQAILGKAILDASEMHNGYICKECCEAIIWDHDHPEDCEHFMERWV